MIVVEVKDGTGKLVDRREFSIYATAVEWWEWALEAYGRSVSIMFKEEGHAVAS